VGVSLSVVICHSSFIHFSKETDKMQSNQQPPDELNQAFRQALQKQLERSPRLAPWLVQRSRVLIERFTHFYEALRWLPRWLRRRWQRKLGTSLAGVALALALNGAPGVYAADITVTTNIPAINDDDGLCSLIEALVNATDDAATYADCAPGNGADVITLAGGVHSLTGKYEGDNGLPVITSALTIQGNGATIRRGGPPAALYRVFEIANTGDLTLYEMTITGGVYTLGAGIYNNGGAVTLNHSTISGNINEYVDGGGIVNNGGTVILQDSTVKDNRARSGGGIVNNSGTVTLHNSTVSGNVAEFWNGGGFINRGVMALSNSTVSNNRASGYDSGGIENHGTLTLTNSTVSGNRADSGGGLRNVGGTATLGNTIIANSVSGGDCVRSGGTINASHSLIEGGLSCVNGSSLNNLTGDPNVGPLQDNGAPSGHPTLTHALLAGSPAINQGDNAVCADPATVNNLDQRGVTRPQGAVCDIGAFELVDATAPTASPTQDSPANVHGWNNTNVTVTWNWTDETGGSGLDLANCTTSTTSSGEGEIALEATCADLTGNQGYGGHTLFIDKTAPTISAAATSAPNAAGWYNAAVTVEFTCVDALSGIPVDACPASQTLDGEGAAIASTAQTVTDNAGNTSDTSNVVTLQIDQTPPVVTVTGVSEGGVYPLESAPAPGCDTQDTLSGVATAATVVTSGGNEDGTGDFTATCSGAVDMAGNPAPPASVSYRIESAPPVETLAVVVLGQEGVRLGQEVIVYSGSVVANTPTTGPFLDSGVELSIGQQSSFLGESSAYGDSVKVIQRSVIPTVYYNHLQEGQQVSIGQRVTPLTLPVVALPAFPVISPGGDNITVPQNGALTLVAGSYGTLKVNQKATVIFSGGEYHFASWEVGQQANLYFLAASDIRIAGRLSVGQKSMVGPHPSTTELGASDIVLHVAGPNGGNGSLSGSPKAAQVGQESTLYANIYAPNGTLLVYQKSTVRGALLARWVDIGQEVALTFGSAFVTEHTVNGASMPSTPPDPHDAGQPPLEETEEEPVEEEPVEEEPQEENPAEGDETEEEVEEEEETAPEEELDQSLHTFLPLVTR
jgi:hypothetical protein